MPAPTAAEEEMMMDDVAVGTIGSGVIVHSILDGVQRTEGIRLSVRRRRSPQSVPLKEPGESCFPERPRSISFGAWGRRSFWTKRRSG